MIERSKRYVNVLSRSNHLSSDLDGQSSPAAEVRDAPSLTFLLNGDEKPGRHHQ